MRQAPALPFQVLQQRALDVGALAGVEQVEQGGDGNLVLAEISLASEEEQPVEQVFQPQISADALVEGIFVNNHAICRPVRGRPRGPGYS